MANDEKSYMKTTFTAEQLWKMAPVKNFSGGRDVSEGVQSMFFSRDGRSKPVKNATEEKYPVDL
jgi:hypothetical protein